MPSSPVSRHSADRLGQGLCAAACEHNASARGAWLRHPTTWLIVLLVLLGVYRCTLITRGHFTWGDERCFLPAGRLVDALSSGNYHEAITHLFTTSPGERPARPGFVLVSVVTDLCQRAVAAVSGVSPESPTYYDTASLVNVIVTLGVTWLVCAIGSTWTGSRWMGLLAGVVYSLLGNANVWIRHLMPYEISMLLGLWALWSLSVMAGRGVSPVWRVLLAGVSTAMAYACYPGHYAFVLINGAVALLCLRPRVLATVAFGVSAFAVIVAFEIAARLVGLSYLADLRNLSSTIRMGDFTEGYVFAWHYLRDVEGTVGIVLIVLFTAFVGLVLWRRDAKLPRSARVAIVAALACYLLHASMGVWFSKMVFYGRVLMVYLPILVLSAVLALAQLSRVAWRRTGVGLLCAASAYSFVLFARDYSRVVYPADFLQNAMTNLGRSVHYPPNVLWDRVGPDDASALESVDPKLAIVSDILRDGSTVLVRQFGHDAVRDAKPPFIGVNMKYIGYVRERYDHFDTPEGYELTAEALHPQVFRGAWYEGRKPWERQRLHDRRYTMRLYRRTEPNVTNRDVLLRKIPQAQHATATRNAATYTVGNRSRILQRRADLTQYVVGFGRVTIAFRVPQNPQARAREGVEGYPVVSAVRWLRTIPRS